MPWFPLGPDFTFFPNDFSQSATRLSRRNASGRQAMVNAIAIDPANTQTIYVLSNPWAGGSGAFRSDNGGATWTSIVDDLAATRPASTSPTAIALNPANPSIVYMGWSDGAFYTSTNKGAPGSWSSVGVVQNGAVVTQLIVDPTGANGPQVTIYAGTSKGVFVAYGTSGTSWNDVTWDDHGTPFVDPNQQYGGGPPPVDALLADFSAANPVFYVGLRDLGVLTSPNPLVSGWTNLNALNIGLPSAASVANPYRTAVRLGLCPLAPSRLYAWFLYPDNSGGSTLGIYTTASPLTAWTQVNCAAPPPGYTQGVYAYTFAVAPNSPGDGLHDILFYGDNWLYRSLDAGQTWQPLPGTDAFYADHHVMVFAPQQGSAIPAVYVGCDGGIAMSAALADPTVALTLPASGYDDQVAYDAQSWIFQSLDQGLMASALLSYAGDAAMPAVGYIACGDTGLSGGGGTPGWRSLGGGDTFAVAASPGPSGVSVWYDSGLTYQLELTNDNGMNANLQPGGPPVLFGTVSATRTSYRFVLDGAGLCVAGVEAHPSLGTLSPAITMPGMHTVTVASTQGLVIGSVVLIDWVNTSPNREAVIVTAVTPTSFTATFAKTHIAGVAIAQRLRFVGRIDRSGTITQISQDFQTLTPVVLAVAPANPNLYVCAVCDDNNQNYAIFQTTMGSQANAATVWTELGAAPSPSDAVASLAIDINADIYALLTKLDATSNTPVYAIGAGGWTAIPSPALPSGTTFGPCVADPMQAKRLYAGLDGGVYVVTISGASATWQSLQDNLPGSPVYDLWSANIGTQAQPIVLLRCAIAGRGVYERNVTPNATDPPVALYMRAHPMDLSWYPTVQNNAANPYAPPETFQHYQSDDIKVDPQTQANPPYYTTDPENPLPISHVAFNLLSSNASNLPQQTLANVHMQVNNRSANPQTVWVWAIYCAGAAGVASLSADPPNNNFQFWTQFSANGTIAPNLPAGSPYVSIGPPVQLTNVVAGNSQVASWHWEIPAAMAGVHHCIVAFVNCANAPLSGMNSYDVDSIVMTNRQVSLKNLFLLPGPGMKKTPHRFAVVFNNPSDRPRVSSWCFDLRTMPESAIAEVFIPSEVRVRKETDRTVRVRGRARTLVEHVEMAPFGAHTVYIEVVADAVEGARNGFHVQQVVDGRVVGGTFVRFAEQSHPVTRPPKRPGAGDRPVSIRLAPWIQTQIDARQHVLGRA